MTYAQHNQIVAFIWGIADDVLRDVYVRGKYRDAILPMMVLRRLDALLEPGKDKVLKHKKFMDEQQIWSQDQGLRGAAGLPFYNTSPYTLRQLLREPAQLKTNFETYLNGFSDNVTDIINKFGLKQQLQKLDEANRLYLLIEKFVSPRINLSPLPIIDEDGIEKLPALSNSGMGSIFEELIRRFNEENNEEAGEHFTPRDIVALMTRLVFEPIQDVIAGGTYLIYDDACGSGGMLTEAENTLRDMADEGHKTINVELYGQEVNAETFAICQADMMIQGRDPSNIRFGSTLLHDAFPGTKFDFMLANPPYGKSWSGDADNGARGDTRFRGELPSGETLDLLPRVSDGQLLFLVNMCGKMKSESKLGSRIATVHNGSALFTGDAGSGESNIRRWILENDWLEAIIGLPLKMFYNTGIATYIWVLSNKKPEKRRGKVQLIDATQWFTKLRKNLGEKSNSLGADDIRQILTARGVFEENEYSKIFDTSDFGYRKIVVERPLRLKFQLTSENLEAWSQSAPAALRSWAQWLPTVFGYAPHRNWNEVRARLDAEAKKRDIKVKDSDRKKVREVFCERDEEAIEVLKNPKEPQFEADPELRDTENVPLKENVEEYVGREVLPHVPDAWIDHAATKIGYEISFTKHFYRYQPLRSLEEITTDLWMLEAETEGLLHRITDDLQLPAARVAAPLNGVNGHTSSTRNGHTSANYHTPQEDTP